MKNKMTKSKVRLRKTSIMAPDGSPLPAQTRNAAVPKGPAAATVHAGGASEGTQIDSARERAATGAAHTVALGERSAAVSKGPAVTAADGMIVEPAPLQALERGFLPWERTLTVNPWPEPV